MQKKVYPILFLMITLFVSMWAGLPTRNAAAQSGPEQRTAQCQRGVDALVGRLAEIPRAGTRAREICKFNVRMNDLDSRISDFDKRFVESAIAADMIEIQSLEIALQGATNEEWRGLIQMMLAMHTTHLQMALIVAEEIGADTTPNLTNARVYPETPAYDLGIRRVNLIEKFIDPLMNAGGLPPTPTAIPTDITGTPTIIVTDTGTTTALPTDTETATAFATDTDTATALPTGTGTVTALPTDTITATAFPTNTETATALPTDTETATALPPGTDTPTALPTDTETVTALPPDTDTPTALPPDTDTPAAVPTDMTDTPTPGPFGTPTGTATTVPGGGTGVNFDMLSLHIIEEEHVMSVQVALTAQRLVRNDEIRAFAKHTADAVELHLLLMSDLKHRLFDNYTPPPPNFQRPYQSPRRFEPAVEDN